MHVHIVYENKLTWIKNYCIFFVDYSNEFLNQIIFWPHISTLSKPLRSPVIRPSSKNKNCIVEEIAGKHLRKNSKHSSKRVIKARLLRIEANGKSVDVLNCLKSADHLSYMLSVSAVWIAQARCIKHKELCLVLLTEPLSKETFRFISTSAQRIRCSKQIWTCQTIASWTFSWTSGSNKTHTGKLCHYLFFC